MLLILQSQLTKHEHNIARQQNQISILQNKVTTVQNDLRSEKATVSLLREKNQQEDLGELSYTNAFIDLEEVSHHGWLALLAICDVVYICIYMYYYIFFCWGVEKGRWLSFLVS